MKRNCEECRKSSTPYWQQATRGIAQIARRIEDGGNALRYRYDAYRGPS